MKNLILLILITFGALNIAFSQSEADQILQELSPMLGQNSMGTDFWLPYPDMFYINFANDEAFIIVISSLVKNEIKIKWDSHNIDTVLNIEAAQNTIFRLLSKKYLKINTQDPHYTERYKSRILKNSGINIKSKFPISIQTFNTVNGIKNGSIALPTNSLGKEYMLQTYFTSVYKWENSTSTNFSPSVSITAPLDDTRIELKLASFNKDLKIRFENGDSLMGGESIIVYLNKGDVWNLHTIDSLGDFSGSMLRSNKPVAVLYSHMAINQPQNNNYSEEVHSIIFPINTWGKTYSIPIYRELNDNPTIRIYTQYDSTKIYRNGVYWTTINNSTNSKIFESKIWENGNREDVISLITPTIITSDKPISIMLFSDYIGKKDIVIYESSNMNILSPLEQAVNYASFSLFSTHQGYVYGENSSVQKLELYFNLDENEEIPSDIEFAIIDTNNSEIEWKLIKEFYGSDYSAVEINNKFIAIKEIILPDSCNYFLRSKQSKFSGFVSKCYLDYNGFKPGVDYNVDSFGFQIGTQMNDLTSTDIKTPIVTIEEKNNGNKLEGLVNDNHEHTSKIAQLYMLEQYSQNFDFKLISADKGFIPDVNGNSFVAGMPVQLEFELTKIKENEDAFAVVYACDRAGNDTLIFINEDKFTDVEKEDYTNEYILVTDSEIKLLPKAMTDGFTELSIYNLAGLNMMSIKTLDNANISLANLQSGTYIITLKSESMLLTRKMSITK